MADEEEEVEGGDEGEELQAAEFVPEVAAAVKPDVYTALLALAFVVFFAGTILGCMELHEAYDVQFWVFTKK